MRLSRGVEMGAGEELSRQAANSHASRNGEGTMNNTLYYGDNLEVLRRYIKDETGINSEGLLEKSQVVPAAFFHRAFRTPK